MEPLPPCALTWTVIPLLSHAVPLIGHMSVTDSRAVQYDFGMRHAVEENRFGMRFGPPCRCFRFAFTEQQQEVWDNAIFKARLEFDGTHYHLFSNNCHHFVARVMNEAGIDGGEHGQFDLIFKYRRRMTKLRSFC